MARIEILSAMRTLNDATQFRRDLDANVIRAVQESALELGAARIVVAVGMEREVFVVPAAARQEAGSERSDAQLAEGLRNIVAATSESRNKISVITEHGISGLLVFVDRTYRDEFGNAIKKRKEGSNFVFYEIALEAIARLVKREQDPLPGDRSLFVLSYAVSFVFEFRLRVYQNFSRPLSAAYWGSACRAVGATNYSGPPMHPPWMRLERIGTATLNIDLRKSTFSMELARNEKSYADWVEAFVLILRRIADDNLGIFDKFTGDGGLVHFPAFESAELGHSIVPALHELKEEERASGAAAIVLAVKCAWEMVWAVDFHLERLFENLTIRSRLLGPAVGIALDEARWSVDRTGIPIVVGRGVVHACRACSGTPANLVRITNNALASLTSAIGQDLSCQEVDFQTKEFGEGLRATIFEMSREPTGLCRSRPSIQKLCAEVYQDLDSRYPARTATAI